MATFLDVTALESFSVIFVFIFVLLVIYAILTYTKVLGNNQLVNVGIGFVIAIFVLLSELATAVIKQIAPIFAVILVFVAIISIASKMFGSGSMIVDSASPVMKHMVIVILVIALIVGSLAAVRDQVEVPETGEDFSKTSTVIFHPNFLGLILIFLIAVFTIGLLAVRQT